jgi:hypothetical protein
MLISTSAAPPFCQHHAFVGMLKVMDQLARGVIVDNSADGNFQDDIFAIAAGTIGAFAVTASLCLMFGIETEVNQRIVALAGFENDVATATAITAGRSSARHKFLASKGHTAIPAVARLHLDSCFIDKHTRE